MIVAYKLKFPIVHPVTGASTWHVATVAVPGLDVSLDAIYGVIGELVCPRMPVSAIAKLLGFAERLRCLADKTMNLDYAGNGVEASCNAPPALIEWGDSNDPLAGADLTVTINFDNCSVRTGEGCGFGFKDLYGLGEGEGINWRDEFIHSLERAAQRAAGSLGQV